MNKQGKTKRKLRSIKPAEQAFYSELGRLIKIKRQVNGGTQKRLAQQTALAQSTVCRAEFAVERVRLMHLLPVLITLQLDNLLALLTSAVRKEINQLLEGDNTDEKENESE